MISYTNNQKIIGLLSKPIFSQCYNGNYCGFWCKAIRLLSANILSAWTFSALIGLVWTHERKLMAKFLLFFIFITVQDCLFHPCFKYYFVLIFKDIISLDLVYTKRLQIIIIVALVLVIKIVLSISYEISWTCIWQNTTASQYA